MAEYETEGFFVPCGKAMLMWEACRPDHMADEVPVAYTAHEAMVGSRVQKSAQLSDSV